MSIFIFINSYNIGAASDGSRVIYYPIEESIIREKDLSPIVRAIDERDQRYRSGKVDWSLQNPLDSINRAVVDSLYAQSKTFADFTDDELGIFSLVMHHSPDCEWNIKWTETCFIEMKKNNRPSLPLLGIAIDRMYNFEDGICFRDKPAKTVELIKN